VHHLGSFPSSLEVTKPFPRCFRCSGGDPDSAKSATGRGEQHRPAKPLGHLSHEENNRKQLSSAVHLIQCNCNAVVCQMIVTRYSKKRSFLEQPMIIYVNRL